MGLEGGTSQNCKTNLQILLNIKEVSRKYWIFFFLFKDQSHKRLECKQLNLSFISSLLLGLPSKPAT